MKIALSRTAAPRVKEAVVLTHMLGRYLDDFGNVLHYLHGDGYRVTIYASPPLPTDELSIDSEQVFAEYQRLLPPDVEVRQLPYVRGLRMSPLDVLRMVALGVRLARRHPDAVFQLWSVYLIIAVGVPLRVLQRRSIYLVTGLGPVLGSRGRRFLAFRVVILAAYRFLMSGRNSRCLNHNAEDRAVLARRLHASPEKFVVTPGCGVDPSLFPYREQLPDNPVPVVLVPARLIADKGIHEAVAASGMMHARGVAHEMWFTGAVEPYPWIRVTDNDIEQAQRGNPCVRFIGYQPSMPPVYAKVDVVCYPTRYPEGTPTVLIEAAASGRAAITCDTVGAREIVLHERTGLVVPQNDARALAAGLERLLLDPGLRDRFRVAAHTHYLAHYTKDAALRATLVAFESLGCEFQSERTAPDVRVGVWT